MPTLLNPELIVNFRGWNSSGAGADLIELEMWIDVGNQEHRTKRFLPFTASQDERLAAFKAMKQELLQHFIDNLLIVHLVDADKSNARTIVSPTINSVLP